MPLQLHASSLLKTFKKAVFKLKNPSLLKKKKKSYFDALPPCSMKLEPCPESPGRMGHNTEPPASCSACSAITTAPLGSARAHG